MKCWGFDYTKPTISLVIKVFFIQCSFNATLTNYGALIMIPHVREPKKLNSTSNPLISQAKSLGSKNKGLSMLTSAIPSLDITPIGYHFQILVKKHFSMTF